MNGVSLFRLFVTFFKIGAFTFGGGWAMIVMIERDIVDRHKWMERSEFYDCLSLVQALPGVIAVNIATAVGYRLGRLRAAIVAALGAMLPSFLIILAIAALLNPSLIKTDPTLTAIFKGIRPAVVALIFAPVFNASRAAGITWRTAIIPIGVALGVWSRVTFFSSPIFIIVISIIVGIVYEKRKTSMEKAS